MTTGNCLCGAVSWKIEKFANEMSHCHCTMCRKAHAAPYATYLFCLFDDFKWQSGEDKIARYESSPGFIRAFCSDCGSVVPENFLDEGVSIPAGVLNEDPGLRPDSHIFVGVKAPWYEITGDLPQHDAYSAESGGGPNVELAAPEPTEEGVLKGSCLCGETAYEVTSPIKAVHNCHCSRCRKARAAAHTTNGFTGIDGVTFTRGEGNLKTYKATDAKFFTQVFCTKCGSGMPRLDEGRGIAIIPFGSLDSDPKRGADDHIFVGSKAEWTEISDDLPCFDEMPG